MVTRFASLIRALGAVLLSLSVALPASAQVMVVPGQTTRPYMNLFQPEQTTNTQPGLNVTCSWNSAGTVFTCVKVNVTDTASAAASLLMDLQVGGFSKFSVTKAGALTTATTITATNANIVAGNAMLPGGSTNGRLSSNGASNVLVQSNNAADFFSVTLDSAKTTLSAEGVSVASAATLLLGVAPICEANVVSVEDGRPAQFELQGSNNATVEVRDPGAIFSATSGTAASINIYYDAAGASGAGYYLQNLRGATRTIRFICNGV
ncbi:MAG TPA: hypothetical protein VNJ04_02785 [Gemmatimonadaceae bacterium]|nr:hypothetical protein [Gemmatimonadaceae bacterium]